MVHSPQKPPMFAIKSSMSIGLSSESFVRENRPRVTVRNKKPIDFSPSPVELELVEESLKKLEVERLDSLRKVCTRAGRGEGGRY